MPGADGQDVGIENNVGRRESDFFCQQFVRSLADPDLIFAGGRLTGFVKRHHDHGRAVATNQLRPLQKLGFAFLQADAVDDALAVNALQTGFEDLPVRAVDHDGHTNIVVVQQPQEFLHAARPVEQSFVHVDVDDLRTAFDLIASNADRFVDTCLRERVAETCVIRRRWCVRQRSGNSIPAAVPDSRIRSTSTNRCPVESFAVQSL